MWFRHSNPPLEGRENPAYSSPGRTFSPNLRRASCRYLCPLGPEARQPRSPSRGGPAGAVPSAAAQYLGPTRSGCRSATHEASLALNPVSFFSLHLWQLTYFTALDLLSSSISESDTKASVFPQKKKGHMPGTHIHTPWESRPRPLSTRGALVFCYPSPPNKPKPHKNKTETNEQSKPQMDLVRKYLKSINGPFRSKRYACVTYEMLVLGERACR